MNECSFSGRLARDPELKRFESGKVKVRFCLVVDRRFQNAEGKWESDPSFLEFEAWDKGAETIAERYRKGDFMLVDDASVKTERWKDKDTGQNRERLSFRCNHFELLPELNAADRDREADQRNREERKARYAGADGDGDKAAPGKPAKAATAARGKTKPADDAADGIPNDAGVDDSDIPF